MSDLQLNIENNVFSPQIRLFEQNYAFEEDLRPLRTTFTNTEVRGEVGVYQFDPSTSRTLNLIRKIDRAIPGYILDPVDIEAPFDKRRVIDFLLTDDLNEVHSANCSPAEMYMEFNIKVYKDSPELFWSVFLHEYAHYRYGQLTAGMQRQLSDLLLKNEACTTAFVALVQAVFTDKLMLKSGKSAGESYQESYSAGSSNRQFLLSPESSELPGFKDHRTIEMEVGDETCHFVLGAVTSEILSYMSSLFAGEGVYDIESSISAKNRGLEVDPRYVRIKNFYDLLSPEDIQFIAEACQIYPHQVLREKKSILGKIENHIAYFEDVLYERNVEWVT
ncbi:hypothetical protein KBD81_05830 [Candidatus Woesebacteria bacterium]|nr:hypothetical protein [Candidatus Woesebacteria bacterium]